MKYTGGWKRDYPYKNHKKYRSIANKDLLQNPYKNADLTGLFNGVVNQNGLKNCTACACTGAYEYELNFAAQKKVAPHFSFNFVYYKQREQQKSLPDNSGATIRDGLYILNHVGACTENTYDDGPQNFNTPPDQFCDAEAKKNCIGAYYQLDRDIKQMKACLSEGHPFIFGFFAYDSAKSAPNGNIPMPGKNDPLSFGHAMIAVGYDDDRGVFLIKNSWGNSWGNLGYGTIPYDYLLDDKLSRDFWTIRLSKKV